MSRVGKLPVKIPSNVEVTIENNQLKLVTPKLTISYIVRPSVSIKYYENSIKFFPKEDFYSSSVDIGMDRSNIKNIIDGIKEPFKIILEINGVGYKAFIDGNKIILSLGYSHEIFYSLPENVHATLEKPNLIILTSINKILVGQIAAEIISFRKPEPYKGKGIKIHGKIIVRKESKKK